MSKDLEEELDIHFKRVSFWISWFIEGMQERAGKHDISKYRDPERPMFEEYISKLKEFTFGSPEYKDALSHMGLGLIHHYKSNRHHPEHFPNGINGMNLFDLIEMVCDWMAAASVKKGPINLDYLQDRFDLNPQLREIISHTLFAADMDAINNRVPADVLPLDNFYDHGKKKK